MKEEILYKGESYGIIGAYFEVVYQEWLTLEVTANEIPCEEKKN